MSITGILMILIHSYLFFHKMDICLGYAVPLLRDFFTCGTILFLALPNHLVGFVLITVRKYAGHIPFLKMSSPIMAPVCKWPGSRMSV